MGGGETLSYPDVYLLLIHYIRSFPERCVFKVIIIQLNPDNLNHEREIEKGSRSSSYR